MDIEQIVLAAYKELPPQRFRWTKEEDRFLAENITRLTAGEIADILGRSENAVKIRQVREMIPVKSKQPGWLTGRQAADALGMDVHAICTLAERGILPMERLPGQRRILRIRAVRLAMWAVNPEHWVYFKVPRMRDLHLQRLVCLARDRWDDEWWTFGQAERRLRVARGVIQAHRYRSDPLLRNQIVRWGNWWIKKSAALGLVIQPSAQRPGVNLWSERADAYLIESEEQGLSYREIARRMKWPEFRVYHRLHMLGHGRTPDWKWKRRKAC